jgi:uncharacterized protein YlxW (UPF0749 family)
MSALTKTLLAFASASALLGALPAHAQATTDCSAQRGCAAKFCRLENEITYARAKAYCTDSRLQSQREADVRDKQNKVSEREDELKAARAKGKQEKIDKAQRKLDEARAEYDAALADLNR